MTILLALIRPFLGWIIGAVAIAALAGGFILKIKHDAREALLVKIEKEKTDAIEKARAARDRVRTLCDSNPAQCVPDDWFRD